MSGTTGRDYPSIDRVVGSLRQSGNREPAMESCSRAVLGLGIRQAWVVCLLSLDAQLSGGKRAMAGKILVVDDEPAIREMIGFALSRAGFSYAEAADADQAETEILNSFPDLVLLDWMLPGQSGVDFIKHLRSDASTRSIPIIMLTARGEEDDRVRGLNNGADDYITKPFAPKELMARIEAVLRRVKPEATSKTVNVDGLLLDPVSHRVTAGERDVDLGPTEFRLLHLLMTHPERVYSRDQLLDLVWGRNIHVGARTVDMHVSNLRKALEASGHHRLIQTVRSSGYRLSARSQP